MPWMFDLAAELQTFYDEHVRLGAERRSDLAAKRDLNLDRLRGGLDQLAQETGKPHPYFRSTQNQGGYAMHTLNQDPDGANGYDIDVAVIFNGSDLPDTALAARQRARDALLKKCATFADVPEARTNAVTIWYSEGYHIGFAVYRSTRDIWGNEKLEHAGTEWKTRSPAAVTDWFLEKVKALSPTANPALNYNPKVKPDQFRRIVRFVKWFCRSRSEWSLPGGMIVSTLLAEGTYKPNPDRDDQSLYETLVALRDRTANSKVYNPIDGSDLTAKSEIENQVKRLHRNLKKHIPKLDILFSQKDCTRQKARSAWDWIFNHGYWADAEQTQITKATDESQGVGLPNRVTIKCELSRKENGKPYAEYKSGSSLLRKGLHLTFRIADTNVIPPYDVEWAVTNEGDEAEDSRDLSWSRTSPVATTSTKYKGRQKMTCLIRRGGYVLAEANHIVRIAAGPFGSRY